MVAVAQQVLIRCRKRISLAKKNLNNSFLLGRFLHSLTGKSFRYTESEGKMSIAEILKKEGIREFSKDIRIMSTKELKANFSAVSSKEPKATLIIKNQIWQTYRRIKTRREPATEGNLRSYWYSHIKPGTL